jgi:hypothetical protein
LLAMQGKPANTKEALAAAALQAQTGLNDQEQQQFRQGFLGSGIQFKGVKISDQEFEKFDIMSARLAAVLKVDPMLIGQLAGATLGAKDYKKAAAATPGSTEAGLAMGDLFRDIQGVMRGRGENRELVRQMQELITMSVDEDALKGVFQSTRDAAKLLSAMAELRPGEAFTAAQQAIRGTRAFNEKKAKPFLQRAGVTLEDDFFAAVEKIRLEVDKEARATPGANYQDILKRYFNQKSSAGLFAAIARGAGPGGVFEDREKFMRSLEGEAPAAKFMQAAAADPTGALRQREVEQGQRLLQLRKGARTLLADTIVKDFEVQARSSMGIAERWAGHLSDTIFYGLSDTVLAKQQQMAAEQMAAIAAKHNIPMTTGDILGKGEFTTDAGRQFAIQRAAEQLMSLGIDPMTGQQIPAGVMADMGLGGAAEKMDKAADKLGAAADRLAPAGPARGGVKAVPPALPAPARPAAGMARP